MFMTNVVGHQVLGSAVPFKSEYVYIYIITIITSYYTPVMYIYIFKILYTLDITSNGLTTSWDAHPSTLYVFDPWKHGGYRSYRSPLSSVINQPYLLVVGIPMKMVNLGVVDSIALPHDPLG